MNDLNSYDKIYIVIPALDPDTHLLALTESLGEEGFSHILIVDDGTEEDRKQIFSRLPSFVTLITHDRNLGKGAALRTAFAALSSEEIAGVVTADSDGQHRVQDIKRVADALLCHPESLILGERTFGENIPAKSLIGNRFSSRMLEKRHGISLEDTQTGLRGIPKRFFPELLEISCDRFEYEMEMLIVWGERPIETVEIETVYENGENRGTHFRPVRDSVRVIRVLQKKRKKTEGRQEK